MGVCMKNFGFSLSEVLLTLAIIGIVAAMTVPAIVTYTNGAKFRSQYKKSVSTLNQAALMSKARYGLDYGSSNAVCPQNPADIGTLHPENVWSFCALFNFTLKGWTYHGKITNIQKVSGQTSEPYRLMEKDTIPDNYTDYLAYSFNDGTLLAFHPEAKNCILPLGMRPTQEMFKGEDSKIDLSKCVGFIDVNGATLPNSEVICTEGQNRVGQRSCIVNNNAGKFKDVYPIFFHDANVEPASGAAQFILGTTKI